MEYVEVIGQCQSCKDLITVEMEELPDRRHADAHMHGKFYRIHEGRVYRFLKRPQKRLEHQGVVVPCHGTILLRGGLTPLPAPQAQLSTL